MKKLGCFLVLLMSALIAVPAQASDFTLYGGIQHPGKLTLQNTLPTARTVTFDPKTFGTFGIRYGHGRVIGSEHTLAYSPNFVESDSKAVIYNSNLLIQTPTPLAKGYFTAGLGSIFTFKDTGSLNDFGTKFAINYGGGLKVMKKGVPVGGRFDVRGYAIPSFKPKGLSVKSETLNVLEVSIGVVFSF